MGLFVAVFYFPVGKPVASYETNWKKFSWGKMWVWMSPTKTNFSVDTDTSGRLLLQFLFKKKVMNEGCVFSVRRVVLNDPDTDDVLIDEIVNYTDLTPMTVELEAGKPPVGPNGSLQLSLNRYRFEYAQSDFPYDLSIEMDLNCADTQETYTFSEPLEFRMVQPILGNQ